MDGTAPTEGLNTEGLNTEGLNKSETRGPSDPQAIKCRNLIDEIQKLADSDPSKKDKKQLKKDEEKLSELAVEIGAIFDLREDLAQIYNHKLKEAYQRLREQQNKTLASEAPKQLSIVEKINQFDTSRNYYDLLDVTRDATEVTIRQAYRQLAKQFHPDMVRELDPDLQKKCQDIFQAINTAYHTLYRQDARMQYDNQLANKDQQTQENRHSNVEWKRKGSELIQKLKQASFIYQILDVLEEIEAIGGVLKMNDWKTDQRTFSSTEIAPQEIIKLIGEAEKYKFSDPAKCKAAIAKLPTEWRIQYIVRREIEDKVECFNTLRKVDASITEIRKALQILNTMIDGVTLTTSQGEKIEVDLESEINKIDIILLQKNNPDWVNNIMDDPEYAPTTWKTIDMKVYYEVREKSNNPAWKNAPIPPTIKERYERYLRERETPTS